MRRTEVLGERTAGDPRGSTAVARQELGGDSSLRAKYDVILIVLYSRESRVA